MKLRHNITLKILIFVQILFIFSCKTNKVPEKEYLFTGNKFNYINKGKGLLKEAKEPFSDELENYVKQKPNKQILFVVPLGLWLYDRSDSRFDSLYSRYYSLDQKLRNQAALDSLYIKYNFESYVGKSRWLDRFLYKNGEPPVLADSMISKTSARNLQKYFKNRGWRKAEVTDTLLASGKKAKVQYDINLGRPMIMDTLIYDVADDLKKGLYNSFTERGKSRMKLNRKCEEKETGPKRPPMNGEQYVKSFFGRNSLVKKGDRLDSYVINDEITRLENRLQNMGYFRFNEFKDEIIYYVDTANNIYNVPVRVQIKKSTLFESITPDSVKKDTVKRAHVFKRYKYEKFNITLLKDSDAKEAEKGDPVDTGFYVVDKKQPVCVDGRRAKIMVRDTIAYIVNQTGGRYKNRVLTDMLAIKRGDYYRLNSEIETRRNIYKVNNFNIIKFNTTYEPSSDSTLVTDIILAPSEKYSYELGFEAFSSRVANFGISPNVTFTAKNLFRGAENLSITFGGTLGNIDTQNSKDKLFNASELSAQASLSFPRLLLPFNTQNLIPKAWGPSSAISAGYSAQYNIGLDRRNYSTAISYNFAPTRTTVHQITLWNLQYTQFLNPGNYFNVYTQDAEVRDKVYDDYFALHPDVEAEYDNKEITDDQLLLQIQSDTDFMNNLKTTDPTLSDSFYLMESRRYIFTQNVLISSFKYDFTYDQRLEYFRRRNPLYLRAQMELAGNALSLFNSSLKDFQTSNNKIVKQILGVPYSQFVKLDLDLRKYWTLSGKKSINARLYAGIGIPYGNSFSLPFDRNYSVGGPSDVRAWRAFGFGPGASQLASKQGYEMVAMGNFKLLSSVEYRFPLPSKSFEGALFVDAGNVWGTLSDSPYKFALDSFYKELGIGGGFGVRWNISNFIIRFDFAYKFHDPRRDEGDRWYFEYINLLKPQVNFAIDYPF